LASTTSVLLLYFPRFLSASCGLGATISEISHTIPVIPTAIAGLRAASVNLAEVVEHEIQANGVYVIFQLLAKRIGQSCNPTYVHPHG
jgi:hypothetical protein